MVHRLLFKFRIQCRQFRTAQYEYMRGTGESISPALSNRGTQEAREIPVFINKEQIVCVSFNNSITKAQTLAPIGVSERF